MLVLIFVIIIAILLARMIWAILPLAIIIALVVLWNMPTHAGEFGYPGHQMCHNYTEIAKANTPDEVRSALSHSPDFYPCPTGLPVRKFTCQYDESFAKTTPHSQPSVKSAFLVIADPNHAELTIADTRIPTTDVLISDNSANDWQDLSVTTPWNGNTEIRNTPFSIRSIESGRWLLSIKMEVYVCKEQG